MKLLILALSFLASVSFANPALSAAPAGKKIHKEIKAGQIIAPTAAPTATPASADKSKIKK